MNIKDIIKKQQMLEGNNQSWRSYFQDLAKFCLPRKAFITQKKTKGQSLALKDIFDSTAIRALKIMAAGFHSNLTNPSSKWFGMQAQDLNLMNDHANKIWFKNTEDKMFAALNATNFDTTLQEFYIDAGCFGTGVVMTEEDSKDKIRYSLIPIEQLSLEEDTQGRVNRVYRKFQYTAQQAFDLWGDNAGEAVAKAMAKEEDQQKMIDFVHYVGPRDVRQAGKKDNLNMDFESIWGEISKQEKIAEGGFVEMPYAAGRFWKDSTDVFGYSPAMDVLPDTKMLNQIKKTMIRAAQKIVDPPVSMPSKGYEMPLNMNPAAVNYRDPKQDGSGIEPIMTKGNVPLGFELSERVAEDIEKGFFVPLFQAFSQLNKQMTVPEVQRRIAENMVLLGPVIGRFTQELLENILIRTFNILNRNGEIPPLPESLRGKGYEIVYLGELAKAQRSSEITNIQRFIGDVGSIAQAVPEVLDNVDIDKTIRIIGDVRGINPEILRTTDQVKFTRETRAKAQQDQMMLDQVGQGAKVAKDAASADKDMRIE